MAKKGMSEARLQEIKDRLLEIPGEPWDVSYGNWEVWQVMSVPDKRYKGGVRMKRGDFICMAGNIPIRDFIASSPQDIADLVAEVERLQGK